MTLLQWMEDAIIRYRQIGIDGLKPPSIIISSSKPISQSSNFYISILNSILSSIINDSLSYVLYFIFRMN